MSNERRPVLDRRITIETPTSTKDATGAPTLSWATLAEVGANMKWKGGDESEVLSKVTAKTRVQFLIRYRTDIDHSMRISYDGDYYNILAILDDQWNMYLTIKTELVE